jgi:hypothetical protein
VIGLFTKFGRGWFWEPVLVLTLLVLARIMIAMFWLRAVYNALRAIYNASIVSAGSPVGSTAAYVVSLLISVAVVVLYVSLFALPLIWLLNR